jgi:regulator of replication initiation timing
MATIHKINKQIRETYKELTEVREDLKNETDLRERRILKRREKRIRELLANNSKSFAMGD